MILLIQIILGVVMIYLKHLYLIKIVKNILYHLNINNYNLDIFTLLDNKKIKSLNGHKNNINTVRYFINNKDYNEYLISADDNHIVIYEILIIIIILNIKLILNIMIIF